jgi:O-acetylhomoserine (thiol)-lyase
VLDHLRSVLAIDAVPLTEERTRSLAARVAQTIRDPWAFDEHERLREFLSGHSRVAWVSHAGLKESPYHDLARKYLPRGAGAVFTFGVKGGYEARIKLVESVQLFSHLANVGDTRSLILHPASTTHRQLSDEQRQAAGAGPDVIRLSIGLESAEDLIRDLDEALGAVD